MLRITQLETAAGIVLRVEGRLAGAWVEELRHSCERNLTRRLDLRGLQTVDAEGLMLLRQLAIEGMELQQPSSYLAALLADSP